MVGVLSTLSHQMSFSGHVEAAVDVYLCVEYFGPWANGPGRPNVTGFCVLGSLGFRSTPRLRRTSRGFGGLGSGFEV